MEKIIKILFYFLSLFFSLILTGYSQHNVESDEDEQMRFSSWEKKGLELSIGANLYFASKQTANYYNGAPNNSINLNLLFNNKFYRDEVFLIMKQAYPYIDTIRPLGDEDYNYASTYNMAMDISVGFKYRFHRSAYFDINYSFRRLTCSNSFTFYFPGVPPGNKENPPYSKLQNIVAREDRHYIDLSVGYIFQNHAIVKPFLALGTQFTYIRIKDFYVFFEDTPYDLLQIARYPNYMPGSQDMPNYVDWAGAGFGFLFTAGLKIAFLPAVSIDPVFQVSVASFGNNARDLQGFNNAFCFNYIVGIRLVLNDALFIRNK